MALPLTRFRERLGITPRFALFILALLGLPVALTVAVRTQMELESLDNARAISRLILEFRRYYNLEIVARVQQAEGPVVVTEKYHGLRGAIPIPATMSIELAEALSAKLQESPFRFAFLSDRPFTNRKRPPLDGFQQTALDAFRANPGQREYWRPVEHPGLGRSVRLAIPVRMEAACVACHNAHPESTFRQWKVGDVRGIQDVVIAPRITEAHQRNLAFLAAYLLFFVGTTVAALREYRRANTELRRLNREQESSRLELERQRGQLREQVDELRTKTTVLDRAPFGIVLVDPHQDDMPISYVNDAYCRITGYPREELLGHNGRMLQGPETDRKVLDALRESLGRQEPAEVELVNYRRDGSTFHNRLVLFPSRDEQGRLLHYVGVCHDVTDLKVAEAERQRLLIELQESLKLESVGLTIASIAHDLNTPLGIALTASTHQMQSTQKLVERVRQGEVTPGAVEAMVEPITRAGTLILNNLNKAASLVRSFKATTADASRSEGEWRRVNLRPLLDTLMLAVSPLLKRADCRVEIECPEDLALHTETGALTQVLTNLVVNATTHAFEGVDERRLRIAAHMRAPRVLIEVVDNGVGMEPEVASRAFDPFFTTRREQGGTGLGLFSARRIVEKTLGGRMLLKSSPGAGTHITLELPLDGPKAAGGQDGAP